jgi:hypothetical protein
MAVVSQMDGREISPGFQVGKERHPPCIAYEAHAAAELASPYGARSCLGWMRHRARDSPITAHGPTGPRVTDGQGCLVSGLRVNSWKSGR